MNDAHCGSKKSFDDKVWIGHDANDDCTGQEFYKVSNYFVHNFFAGLQQF